MINITFNITMQEIWIENFKKGEWNCRDKTN
jgi:hypothetical protein